MKNLVLLDPNERGSEFEPPQTRIRSGTLPSGITAKMDVFARHVAEGLSLAEAYRRAFNTANMKPRTVSNDASRLAKHPGVSAAIMSYRAEYEAQKRMAALERDQRIWAVLWQLVEDEAIPPTVRVKALDLAARICGMFKHAPNEAPLSAAEIEDELVRRLGGTCRI